MEVNNACNTSLDYEFSNGEVMKHINLLKSGKASGHDMILNEMIKKSSHYLLPAICKLFNLILNSGKFLSLWNCS
jgi:hypothetical protein